MRSCPKAKGRKLGTGALNNLNPSGVRNFIESRIGYNAIKDLIQ